MVCGSCILLPIAIVGIGISFTDAYVIGMLITILSLTLYLHFREIKKCKQCIN
jgi:hypothetical protein